MLLLGVPCRTKVKSSIPYENQQGLGGSRYFRCPVCSREEWTSEELVTPIPLAGAAEIWYFVQSSLKINGVGKNHVWCEETLSEPSNPHSCPVPLRSLVSVRNGCIVARSKPLGAVRPLHDICWKCAYKVSFLLKKKNHLFLFYLCVQHFIFGKSPMEEYCGVFFCRWLQLTSIY